MPPSNQSCSEVKAVMAIAVIDIPGNIGKSILKAYELNG